MAFQMFHIFARNCIQIFCRDVIIYIPWFITVFNCLLNKNVKNFVVKFIFHAMYQKSMQKSFYINYCKKIFLYGDLNLNLFIVISCNFDTDIL